jgi:hypothetical protein
VASSARHAAWLDPGGDKGLEPSAILNRLGRGRERGRSEGPRRALPHRAAPPAGAKQKVGARAERQALGLHAAMSLAHPPPSTTAFLAWRRAHPAHPRW